MSEDDRAHMHHALRIAARGLGSVWPNPAVGCVIVQQGRIVGRGWTQPGGRPHAETRALAQAGQGRYGLCHAGTMRSSRQNAALRRGADCSGCDTGGDSADRSRCKGGGQGSCHAAGGRNCGHGKYPFTRSPCRECWLSEEDHARSSFCYLEAGSDP